MTFYCVSTTIYDCGRTTLCISHVEAEEKPKNSFKSTPRADYYNDYFDTAEEAEKFYADNNIEI